MARIPNMMRSFLHWRLLLLILTAAILACRTPLAAQPEDEVFRLAVMRSEGLLFQEAIVENLIETLKKALGPGVRLEVFRGTAEEIKARTQARTLDLIFCNSVLYRALLPWGVRDLATLHSEWNPNPNRAEGSVLVVRRADGIIRFSDFFALTKPAIAVGKHREFDVLYYLLQEVASEGLDADRFRSFVHEREAADKEIVSDVIEGRAVAGMISTCFLEHYVVSNPYVYQDLVVLNPLRSSELPCTVSTMLYPNWSVLITPTISMKRATDVAAALLNAPRDLGEAWWSVSTQFETVDEMLRSLRVEQYAYLREWTLRKFVEKYFVLIVAFGTVFGMIVLYSILANRLIKVRTRQLSQSLSRQVKYRKEYEILAKNNEIYRRMGMVSQISSVISHELRQPLNTIGCYAQGLLMQLEKGSVPPGKIADIVYEIHRKTQHANEIIKSVRNFSKYGSRPVRLDFARSVRRAIDNYLLGSRCSEEILFHGAPDCWVAMDPFELELMVINLLRNASDALKNTANSRITVSISPEEAEPFVRLVIEDNGPKISEALLTAIQRGFESSKKEGSGMGLMIVSEIVSKSGGRLSFEAKKISGLRVVIWLPVQKNDDK